MTRIIHAAERPTVEEAHKARRRRGEMVELMLQSEGWELVAGEIHAAIDREQAKILQGRLTPDDYRYRAGILRGLETALEFAAKLARQAHGGPDDGNT